jgi:serine protease AprX
MPTCCSRAPGCSTSTGRWRWPRSLRTDIASAVAAGTLKPGDAMLAPGRSMGLLRSTIGGKSVEWSRMAYAGGNQIFSGNALFAQYQPIYDPRITWAGGRVLRTQPVYWSGLGIPPNTFVKSFSDSVPTAQPLLTPLVVKAGSLLGSSSLAGKTGAFTPAATLSAGCAAAAGRCCRRAWPSVRAWCSAKAWC